MVLRPNLTHAGHNLPIYYARKLAEDFRFAAARGMLGSSFDSLFGSYATQGPNLYTLARIHQRPEWSANQILDEYYGAFGLADEEVRRYFEHWESLSDRLTVATMKRITAQGRGGGFRNYVGIIDRLYTQSDLAQGFALLELAAKKAEGDAMSARRVAFLKMGLRDAELTIAVARAKRRLSPASSGKTQRAYRAALETLVKHRQKIGSYQVCNIGYLTYREQMGGGWQHGDFSP